MTHTLTNAGLHAMMVLETSKRKSGAFYRDLGVAPQTLARLENDGLVGALYRPATGETSILRRSWFLTDAGRAALASHKTGG